MRWFARPGGVLLNPLDEATQPAEAETLFQQMQTEPERWVIERTTGERLGRTPNTYALYGDAHNNARVTFRGYGPIPPWVAGCPVVKAELPVGAVFGPVARFTEDREGLYTSWAFDIEGEYLPGA